MFFEYFLFDRENVIRIIWIIDWGFCGFYDWKREESKLLILLGREGWFSLPGLPGYFGDNVAEEQDVVGVAKV